MSVYPNQPTKVPDVVSGIEDTTAASASASPAVAVPDADPLLQFFAFAHLTPFLKEISQPFGVLAHDMVVLLPRNAERSAMLRKLLEAKDCAVRAKLFRSV